MKTLLALLAGICLMTGTASARDHHYHRHHYSGGHVRYYSRPSIGFSFGTTYASPYYSDPYYYGPVYSRPYYPYSYNYGPSVYVSGSRYYGGRSYHGSHHHHHHHR